MTRVEGSAPFRTRIVVRRPGDPGRFSGALLVEWLNVSSGFESDPDWAYMHEEILRAGHAYVAVSAQLVGVHGGAGTFADPFPGLRGFDPVRYGTLAHPGDQYSFDMFRQIALALGPASRPAAASAGRVLGGLAPGRVLALGESLSAYYLTSYIKAVQPTSPVFGGFLVHSRGAGAAPLSGARITPAADVEGVHIRTDNAALVLVLQAEGTPGRTGTSRRRRCALSMPTSGRSTPPSGPGSCCPGTGSSCLPRRMRFPGRPDKALSGA